MKNLLREILFLVFALISINGVSQRTLTNFNKNWNFFLGDDSSAKEVSYDDSKWRVLNLPHDWSIEGNFSKDHPTTFNQGALPAGIGWYRKKFVVPSSFKGKTIFIDFDGIYRNSEVWINGHYLGKRPNGYISFRYQLTPYLKFDEVNVIAVKVDNSAQPSSRWYTGSGIYRNVWLVATSPIAIDDRGVFVSTKKLSAKEAVVEIRGDLTQGIANSYGFSLACQILNANGKIVSAGGSRIHKPGTNPMYSLHISNPKFWSPENPYLYRVVINVLKNKKVVDKYEVRFGIRDFKFDAANGFLSEWKESKDLGCLHAS